MEQAESLSRSIAERIVKMIMGFTDSEEDQMLWKWQLRTVEVNRVINRVQGILDGYEIKPKESKPTPEEMRQRIDDNFFEEEYD